MIAITISDLVKTLRKAASNPERHASAQIVYFSPLKDNSVLTQCDTACCVAGDLMLRAHADEPQRKIDEIIEQWATKVDPWLWVSSQLELTELEAELAFGSNTHYLVHLLLADLLEAGLRLDHSGGLEMSCVSTYECFDWARIGGQDNYVDLEELLDWMQSIAK